MVFHQEITTTDSDVLFDNLKSNLNVGRYHSWTVDNPIPHELKSNFC